jgi:hypothetical protein
MRINWCPAPVAAEVLYAGSVPTLIHGASVVIIRVPSGISGDLRIGNRRFVIAFKIPDGDSFAAEGTFSSSP